MQENDSARGKGVDFARVGPWSAGSLYITVVNRSEATACNKHGAMKLWFLWFLRDKY